MRAAYDTEPNHAVVPAGVKDQETSVTRHLKNTGKQLLRRVFELGQRCGVDILPRHFYSQVPEMRSLRATQEWRRPLSMQGIMGDLDAQVDFLRRCTTPYRDQLAQLKIHSRALQMNQSDQGFGEMEAEFLYCFVRHNRPQRIVQVGCGVSTAVCLLAAQDEAYQPNITCIEPYPTAFLKQEAAAGRLELIEKKIQDVDTALFRDVGRGDLFFVDSSHTLGPSGEVTRIVADILPQIPRGAYVHFHDIWFPYDYCPHILSTDLFFLYETPLLYSFLCMNERYRIDASLSQLFHGRLREMQSCLPGLAPAEFEEGLMIRQGHYPSSLYLRA